MNTLIIGGTSGLGAVYAYVLRNRDDTVLATGRESHELASGAWLSQLGEDVDSAFGSPESIGHVVIAAYDRLNLRENIQLHAARALWPLFKRFYNTTFTLVGDASYQLGHNQSTYTAHKHALAMQAQAWARDDAHDCSLFLLDLGVLENRRVRGVNYMLFSEAVQHLDLAMQSHRRFKHLTVLGSRKALDDAI